MDNADEARGSTFIRRVHRKSNEADKYMVEKEDDMGQQQQVSGGFGDSQQLDEKAVEEMKQKQHEQG